MWFSRSGKQALVTVTTPGFLSGTLVMLHSFAKHNPWFEGDRVVIYDDTLSPQDMDLLARLFGVHFIRVDARLMEQTQALCLDFPDYKRRMGQFYSLEAFRLSSYRQILFMDSDTLFRGSVESLFQMGKPLLVCRKSGKFRHPEPINPDRPFSLEQFNAGMMLIDKSLLGEEMYETMLKKVTPTFFFGFLQKNAEGQWDIPARFGTDQLIFNAVLQDEAQYVSMRYNYRFGVADEILRQESIAYEDAVVVHFTGRKKPWLEAEAIRRVLLHPHEVMGFADWTRSYLELLEQCASGSAKKTGL
jgi:lipopolysaccharide biosynthesis glycosyltransferase